MSGLCGIVHMDGRPGDEDGLKAMIEAGRHRASQGVASSVDAGCAMAQLFSLERPGAEHEHPSTAALGERYRVVADARIHNRTDLLSALRPRQERTQEEDAADDTLLLLEAFLRWGNRCCDHLIGDYAFVIWDRLDRRLFAARDPMAMRPLYYCMDSERCVFASEIGQILAVAGVEKRVFRPMAAAWLMTQAGDPSWTFFKGVHQVPGAHALSASPRGSTLERVWDIDPGVRLTYASDDEYADHFREILLEATRCRMGGGHHTGMLLSGGLDSCAVAGAAGFILDEVFDSDPSSRRFTTYAYRYEGFPECDERHISEPLARYWGMEIDEISSDEWKQGDLLRTDWGIDSPVVGVYRPLQEAAARRAKRSGVRRMFTGARGDNMMGGFLWDPVGLLTSGSPIEAYRELSSIGGRYRGNPWRAFRKYLCNAWMLGLASRFGPLVNRHIRRHERKLDQRRTERRLTAAWVPERLLEEVPLERIFPASSPVRFAGSAARARRELIFDGFTELGNLQNERHLASHGLFYDDPWSDRRILEFVAAVPQFVLNRVGETKRVTRRALSGLVPAEVQVNARKILPATFGAHALREKEGEGLIALTANMQAARSGLVHEAPLRAQVRSFVEGGELVSSAWPAVTLESWMRTHALEA